MFSSQPTANIIVKHAAAAPGALAATTKGPLADREREREGWKVFPDDYTSSSLARHYSSNTDDNDASQQQRQKRLISPKAVKELMRQSLDVTGGFMEGEMRAAAGVTPGGVVDEEESVANAQPIHSSALKHPAALTRVVCINNAWCWIVM